MIWSLEPVSERMTVPEQAGIDQNGLLTVSKFIPPDNYTFVVKVANEAGYDRREIVLEVKDSTIQPGPRIPGISGATPVSPAAGLSFPGPAASLLQAAPAFLRNSEPLPSRQLHPVQLNGARNYKSDKLRCLDFWLAGVDLSSPPGVPAALTGYSCQ